MRSRSFGTQRLFFRHAGFYTISSTFPTKLFKRLSLCERSFSLCYEMAHNPETLTTSSSRNAAGMPSERLPTWATWLKRIRGALSRRQECGMKADLHTNETRQISDAAVPGWCSDTFSRADNTLTGSLKLLHSLSSDVDVNHVSGSFLPKNMRRQRETSSNVRSRTVKLVWRRDGWWYHSDSNWKHWKLLSGIFYTMIAWEKKRNRILHE